MVTFFKAFLFAFPSPLFAAVVVFVARLTALSQTFLIMMTTMTDAMMLLGCLGICGETQETNGSRGIRGARDGTMLLRRLCH